MRLGSTIHNIHKHIYHYILEVNHNTKYITVDIISSYHIANIQSPLFVKLLAPDYVIIILAIHEFGVLYDIALDYYIFDFI